MTYNYFKRHWNETTGDPLTGSWGTSTYYFETNGTGDVLRQLELYQNGRMLRYHQKYVEDDFGGLAKLPLDLTEFEAFTIDKATFEEVWLNGDAR